MEKKWRKTGAALLIAGLTVSGTGYALAEGGKVTEIFDLSELDENKVEEQEIIPVREVPLDETANATVLETGKQEETAQADETDGTAEFGKEDGKQESDKDALPEIPEGYTAGNLAALSKAYEQAGNPTAKAAIKRNMERSIAKWESKQPVAEAPKEEAKEKAPVTEEKPKVEEPAKDKAETDKPVKDKVKEEKPAKAKEKNPQAELNAKHKEQKDELKAAQKAEREALKEERKAAKEERKAAKEQRKKEKKN